MASLDIDREQGIYMWVIANGANKSGSTWIFQLLEATGSFSELPSEFQDKRFSNASVAPNCISKAVGKLGSDEVAYVSKQHWPQSNAETLSVSNIKMVNIIRDIRDMVVSRYHHEVRVGNEINDISQFIREKGASLVSNYCSYHQYWLDSIHVKKENYFITSYEHLRTNDMAAANELFDFTELDISFDMREKAVEKNRFESKTNTGSGSFFRKGKVFGFKDEIDEHEEGIILDSAMIYGLREIKKKILSFNINLMPYLKGTDVGM